LYPILWDTYIHGVEKQLSSVSTNIVLTARKALSLCFSVWWFGNEWNMKLGTGAFMVFCGSLVYTLALPKEKINKSSDSKYYTLNDTASTNGGAQLKTHGSDTRQPPELRDMPRKSRE
jgi:hypothetical protein